ncbi:MAG: hypothetical protein GVY36_01905 [Verrucomicrobia bacterium]|jgi:hypothetical protein|nr:hypothetical protein [Verrucomicrobiota bacterium]
MTNRIRPRSHFVNFACAACLALGLIGIWKLSTAGADDWIDRLLREEGIAYERSDAAEPGWTIWIDAPESPRRATPNPLPWQISEAEGPGSIVIRIPSIVYVPIMNEREIGRDLAVLALRLEHLSPVYHPGQGVIEAQAKLHGFHDVMPRSFEKAVEAIKRDLQRILDLIERYDAQ